MHAHRGAHEMRPQRARRDPGSRPRHLMVLSLPTRPSSWMHRMSRTRPVRSANESAAGLGRRHREGSIVGQPISLGEPAIGRRDRRDAGQRQRLRQPVLQGAEGALGPSTCSGGRAPPANRPRYGGCRAAPGRARPGFARSSTPAPPEGPQSEGSPDRSMSVPMK